MGEMVWIASLATVFALIAGGFAENGSMDRLPGEAGRPSTGRLSTGRPPRIGISAVITAACATLRGGGTIQDAFAEQSGRRFAVPQVTAERLRRLLEEHALPDETAVQIGRTSAELAVACRISAVLGCPAVRCLEAVRAAYRRSRLLADLRAQAFAVPQATIRLLSALPAITIMLGELLGARPLSFLLGSAQGAACMVLGACCYTVGMAWTRAMLRGMERR